MPRKPEDPRPSRRYNPEADLSLDRLKSASAIVAPPGFAALAPFSLAALFAQPGAGSPSLSFQVMTQHSAPGDQGAGPREGEAPSGPRGGGGSRDGGAPSGPSADTGSHGGSPSRAGPRPADQAALVSHTDTDTSSGGGMLPGRGGSGGRSGGPRIAAANAQPGRGPVGAGSFFGASVGGPAGGVSSTAPAGPAPAATGAAGAGQAATAPPAVGSPSPTPTAAGSTAPAASSIATSATSTAQSSTGRAGHPTVQNFGPQATSATSNGLTASSSLALGSLSFASPTFGPAPSSTGSSAPGGGQTSIGTSGGSGSLSPADVGGGAGIQGMPVGGGKGDVFGQVWKLHPAPPYDPPYGGGPADEPPDGAPFQTLNALILSYIDQALANIVPSNTSGSNVATNPASLSVTGFDGLGTFTFSATANYDIDGAYISGSFSTTDSATLIYSFHDAGYTPDGHQFTLDDKGGGTLNIHAVSGSTVSHPLTDTLFGSDSYTLTQVLAQADSISGSYTSAESTTDTIGGSDSMSLTETQTQTLLVKGGIFANASDTYTYNENGTDTSSQSDQGNDTVSGTSGVTDVGRSSAAGSGTGGHTEQITGSDWMNPLAVMAYGTATFTWSGSDSESLTTTSTDSGGVTLAGAGQTDSATTTETTSDSASDGQTGTMWYTDSETNSFGWTQTLNYAVNSQDQGWDQGTETSGAADTNPDGGDSGGGGRTFSTTFTDHDGGQVTSTLTDTGSQSLSNSIILSAGSTFTWSQQENDTATHWESATESSSSSDSGTEITAGETESTSEGSTETGGSTDFDVATNNANETDTGSESLGTYGLIAGGADTITSGGATTDNDTSTESNAETTSETVIDTNTGTASETSRESDLLTGSSNAGETATDTATVLSDTATLALGAGGQVLGFR